MKNTRLYPLVQIDTAPLRAVTQAGGVTLTETVAVTGLGAALTRELGRWRKPLAVHDPAKVLLDLALTLALGGEHLSDIAVLRSEPALYGRVASDPTVSRVLDALAADAPAVLKAIDSARAHARAQAWSLAGVHAPDHATTAKAPLVIDLDATLVTSHSDKQHATRTWKKGYGFHPLCAFLDHGAEGTGEPLTVLLRPGNAGSNTAADHITVCRQAFRQLPGHRPGNRPGRRVLVRTDGAGATHDFTRFLHTQRVSYSIGFALPTNAADLLKHIPATMWEPAIDSDTDGDGAIRDGAWGAELTGLLDLNAWPAGMRVIARKERPHPGAQLRITDIDGLRVTAFATNTPTGGGHGQLADLELRHRRRVRCEDRIRVAKDTGLRALPLHDNTCEPDLDRGRRARRRPPRLDGHARSGRHPRPPLGTQTPPATTLHRPSNPRPPRTTTPRALRRAPSLGRTSPRRRQPAPAAPTRRPRLTPTPTVPTTPAAPRTHGTPPGPSDIGPNCPTHLAESTPRRQRVAIRHRPRAPTKFRG